MQVLSILTLPNGQKNSNFDYWPKDSFGDY